VPNLGRSSDFEDQPAVVPGQIDLASLLIWMDEEELGSGPLEEVVRLEGGTQNMLVRFRRDDQTFVLRRPPLHMRSSSNLTMRREASVLAALSGTAVPHPRLIRACDDETVIGAAFFLMEAVDGFNVLDGLGDNLAADLAAQRAMGTSVVDAIALLSRVDYQVVGLGALGRADGWLERQVAKWLSLLSSFEVYAGYSSAELPHVDELASWLTAWTPVSWVAGLIHGDVHFANVLVRRDVPEVAALVDWELATIGDPLLDLGHMLMLWPRPANRGVLWQGPDIPGLPSARDLIERYALQSERDVSDVLWYCVLACFRLAILFDGTHARALAGQADPQTGATLHASGITLLHRAHELIHMRLTLDDL
jgi:aminoglycoside phosphotransferase (APT) family kinase protein